MLHGLTQLLNHYRKDVEEWIKEICPKAMTYRVVREFESGLLCWWNYIDYITDNDGLEWELDEGEDDWFSESGLREKFDAWINNEPPFQERTFVIGEF